MELIKTFIVPMPMRTDSRSRFRCAGFTLTELVVVLVMVSMFVMLAVLSFGQILGRYTFKSQVQELMHTFQLANTSALESDRRYEIIIDIQEQTYLLRQITSPDLSQVLDEEIIVENELSDNCHVLYVMFDDGDFSNDSRVFFRAGHGGWQYGGKIVMEDSSGGQYSIVVSRLGRDVKLLDGDVELLEPKSEDEIPF
jgi:prepilin-type N-terminal cleavage/methylation domain-containing protein